MPRAGPLVLQTAGLLRGLMPLLVIGGLALGQVASVEWRQGQVLVVAALFAALVTIGRRGADWLLPRAEPVSRVTCAATVALIVATMLPNALGAFGLLRPRLFLAAVTVLYAVVVVFGRGWGRAPTAPVMRDPRSAALAAARTPDAVLLMITGALLVGFVLGTIVSLRESGPGLFSYDDNGYHATAVATWARHGDLRMPKFSFGDASTPFYPIGSELVGWSLLAPFGDSDVLARWSQLPFLLAAAVAVGAVARRLGLGWRSAFLAALAFAALPRLFPDLALGAGNDLSTAFWTLAALDAAMLLAVRQGTGVAAYLGLAVGGLLGTKYIGLLFTPPVLAVATVVGLLAVRRRQVTIGKVVGLAGVVAATAVVAGGYTYLRNALTVGNPIYPAGIRLLGQELLPGRANASLAARMKAPEAALDVVDFLFHRPRALGVAFPGTMLPASLVAPVVAAALAFRRRAERESRLVAAMVLVLPVVFFLEFRYLMYDHRDVRYLVAGLAVAAVALAWVIDRLPGRLAVVARCVVAGLVLGELVVRTDRLHGRAADAAVVTSVVLLAGAGVFVALAHRWRTISVTSLSRGVGAIGPVVAGLALVLSAPLAAVVDAYQESKLTGEHPHAPEQPAAAALERLVGPDGGAVAYTGSNRPYLFFGSRLQNDLAIVPTTTEPWTRTYDWGGSPEHVYGRGGTVRRWVRNLRALGVRYVVLARLDGTDDPERGWMLAHPDGFRRVYADAVGEIWELDRRWNGPPPRRGRQAAVDGVGEGDGRPALPAVEAHRQRAGRSLGADLQ